VFFFSVLRTGFVADIDFTTEDDTRALQQCFRNGWLHTDKFVNSIKEWKLWGIADATSFDCADILELVINVFSIFSLRAPRDIGPGHVQRLPEAQYQDQFYRCCHTYSKSPLITFPEFDMAKGRVDFYIPAKQWEVELLRDGNQLAQHSGRFSSRAGSCVVWQSVLIILIPCMMWCGVVGNFLIIANLFTLNLIRILSYRYCFLVHPVSKSRDGICSIRSSLG
jgi:hypothetical protein